MKRLNEWKRVMGLYKRSKAFTLIELIVVMAIIGILVLLAAPRFFGQTEEAIFTKHISNARNVEDASERYFIAEQDWPRLTDEAYTDAEVEAFADKIYDITGEEIDLDPDGDYYDIDYDALSDFVRVDASDKAHYILQNPVGKVYYLEGLTDEARGRVMEDNSEGQSINVVPGTTTLIGGTMQAGFFGEVPASQLITGDALSNAVGITQGTSQHSDTPWLKFAYNNKIQFVPQKTIRYNISWDAIHAANAVYGGTGGKEVVIRGKTYVVRLMRGSSLMSSYWNGSDIHGSEWNRLMLPIHHKSSNPSLWGHIGNIGALDRESWGINYTDEDLLTHGDYGSGAWSWTQERYSDTSKPSARMTRGLYGASRAGWATSSMEGGGWRPVLELVE